MKIIGIISSILFSLIFLFFSIGLVIPRINYESSIEIEKPVVLVYNMFTNSNLLDDWLTGFQKIEQIEGKQGTIGSKYLLTWKKDDDSITETENVVDIREYERLIISGERETMWVLSTIKFRSYDSITEVTFLRSVKGKNPVWRSLLPFYKSQMEQELTDDLMNLKIVLEGRN